MILHAFAEHDMMAPTRRKSVTHGDARQRMVTSHADDDKGEECDDAADVTQSAMMPLMTIEGGSDGVSTVKHHSFGLT